MKRPKLPIGRYLKGFMLAAALIGGSLCVKAKPSNIIAFAPIALVANMKKKGVELSEDEEGFAKSLEDQLNEAFKQLGQDKVTTEGFKTLFETALSTTALDVKNIKIGDGDNAKSIEDILKDQGEFMANMKDSLGTNQQKQASTLELITKALEDNKERLTELGKKSGKAAGFVMEIKASNSTITTGYASSAPNAFLPVPMFMPGYHTSPEIAVTIMDLVDMGTSSTPVITWVNEQPIEGDAGWTAEGTLKSQVAWKYTSETSTADKVTAFVKVTDESLKDIPFLAGRINSRLRELLMRKIQDGIINGNGSGNTPNGIVNQSPAYTTDSFDDSVVAPTTADALLAMAGQIDELEYDTENLVVVMNGVDIRKMKWEKDENNNYIIPPFTTANGTYIDNMRVVKNNKITKGYALVGDLKKFMVLMVDGLTIEMGLDGNDFTYNLRTIRGEARLITAVSDNDLGAFVYDALATVKAEIDSAV